MPAGRPKGSKTMTPDAKAFVARVESMLRKQGHTGGLENMACRFITGEDTKTGFGVWRTLMGYKFGLPAQTIEANVTLNYTEALAKMRAKREQ
jgi:ribosomal protein S28E/S33